MARAAAPGPTGWGIQLTNLKIRTDATPRGHGLETPPEIRKVRSHQPGVLAGDEHALWSQEEHEHPHQLPQRDRHLTPQALQAWVIHHLHERLGRHVSARQLGSAPREWPTFEKQAHGITPVAGQITQLTSSAAMTAHELVIRHHADARPDSHRDHAEVPNPSAMAKPVLRDGQGIDIVVHDAGQTHR